MVFSTPLTSFVLNFCIQDRQSHAVPGFLGTSEGDIHQPCEIPVNMLMWSWRRSSKAKKKLHHQSQPNRANAQPAVPNLLSDSSPLSSDFFFNIFPPHLWS